MNRRTALLAGAATVAVTAASLGAVAAAQPGPTYRSASMGTTGMAWAARCTPPALPGTQVDVVAADMAGGGMMGGLRMMSNHGMMGGRMMLHAYPASVPAGTVSLRVVNHGTRAHELVILSLAAGQSVGTRAVGSDKTVDEAGSLGEASDDCAAGAGVGIRPGGAGWVTLTLAPGRYELLCNLPGHYAAGMFTELDVT